jgi:cysteine-rich repeat protein
MRLTMTHQRRFGLGTALLLWSCTQGAIDLGDRGDAGDASGGSGAIGATGGKGSGGASAGRCGDGILQSGESCDDANVMGGDGCSATCLIETGYTCPTPGQPCVPGTTARCGDGIQQSGESCDDANVMGGDGCSATCTIEAGYTCPTPGQPCVPDSGCASRPESTCKTDCAPIYASPTGDLVNNRVYVGCQDYDIGCTAAMTCGYPAGQPDSCMLFSSGCMPSGWTPLANCGTLSSCPS